VTLLREVAVWTIQSSQKLENRIKTAETGAIFVTSDFSDLASKPTVRKNTGATNKK